MSDDVKVREAYNDDHIAPKLLAIAEECHANGLSFCARVEWDTFEGQTTYRSAYKNWSASLAPVYIASMANGNLDKFLMSLVQAHQEGNLDLSHTLLSVWAHLEPFTPKEQRS